MKTIEQVKGMIAKLEDELLVTRGDYRSMSAKYGCSAIETTSASDKILKLDAQIEILYEVLGVERPANDTTKNAAPADRITNGQLRVSKLPVVV